MKILNRVIGIAHCVTLHYIVQLNHVSVAKSRYLLIFHPGAHPSLTTAVHVSWLAVLTKWKLLHHFSRLSLK